MFVRWATVGATGPGELADRMMCIYGTKGCGKSVLATYIVKRLELQDKVASLYSFWAVRASQRKLVDFLRTYLWHLLQHVSDKDLYEIYTALMKSLPIDKSNLGDAIKAAGRLIGSAIYCVIDAIDESLDDWSRIKDGSLKYILELAKALPNLRIILLGREPAMRAAMTISPLSIEITEDIIRHDIHKFIDVELDRSLKVQTPVTRELVRQSLQEKSTNMFLWVSLVFTELGRCYLESEIKHSLEHLPHDLDREYHRLFTQLITRLGGTLARPSIFLQRTKCLLSLIIAATEPLTCDELRHAFASCQSSEQSYEEFLITPEGIIDSIGDFVRVWDGRYHIAHTSLTDFLTRELELWEEENKSTMFFRIDLREAHSIMCLACLNYFVQFDLGYPMTDDSLEELPTRLVFFQYALENAPYHLMEACLVNLNPLVESRFYTFLGSSQFCAFIEYLFLCAQHDEWTLMYGYTELWEALQTSENLAKLMKFTIELSSPVGLFKKELCRREIVFGPDDKRCQSWRSLMMVLATWIDDIHEYCHPSLDDEDSKDPHDNGHRDREFVTQVARGHVSNWLHHLSTGHHDPLKGMNLVVRLRYKLPISFSALSAEVVPITLLILWSLQASGPAQQISLISIALRRLKGQGNFCEASCFNLIGIFHYYKGEEKPQFYRRALEIAIKLPPLPHVEYLTRHVLNNLSQCLSRQKKIAESRQVLLQLRERLLVSSVASPGVAYTGHHNASTKRPFRFFQRKIWRGHNAYMLSEVASCHYRNGDYEDAHQIADLAIESLDKSRLWREAFLSALETKADSTLEIRMFDTAEQTYRKMLHEIDRSNKKLQLSRRWNALSGIAWCLFKQGKETEAKQWIQRTALNLVIVEMYGSADDTQQATSNTISNVTTTAWVSIYLGEFGIAEKLLNKAFSAANPSKRIAPEPYLLNLNKLAETLGQYRQSFKKRKSILKCYQLLAALESAGCTEDPLLWDDQADKAHKTDEFQYGRCVSPWDVIHLKAVDVSVARHGILSGLTFYLYMELVTGYNRDGEHKAAAVVLQDYISRHTSATREAAIIEDQCYEFVFKAAPSAYQRSGSHPTSSALSYEVRW